MTKSEAIVLFYNYLGCGSVENMEEIPEGPLKVLMDMEHKYLVAPFVKDDLRKKHYGGDHKYSVQYCAKKYGVTRKVVVSIGQSMGVLSS